MSPRPRPQRLPAAHRGEAIEHSLAPTEIFPGYRPPQSTRSRLPRARGRLRTATSIPRLGETAPGHARRRLPGTAYPLATERQGVNQPPTIDHEPSDEARNRTNPPGTSGTAPGRTPQPHPPPQGLRGEGGKGNGRGARHGSGTRCPAPSSGSSPSGRTSSRNGTATPDLTWKKPRKTHQPGDGEAYDP
mgnify:FL=1